MIRTWFPKRLPDLLTFGLLMAMIALTVTGCTSKNNIVMTSTTGFGITAKNNPDGTIQGGIGYVGSKIASVPLVRNGADGTPSALRVKGICGQENAITAGALTKGGGEVSAAANNAGISMDVGEGVVTGALGEYLGLALLARATNGEQPNFTYDCTKTLMDEKAYRGSGVELPSGPIGDVPDQSN
jgi:hypothetical protein